VQYAQQLEFKGDYEGALKMYDVAMTAMDDDGQSRLCSDAELALCKAGYARCTLRMGNLRKGTAMVAEANDPQLCRDCAAILEGNKATLSEAAALYERAQLYEKAAAIYIQIKSFSQAARIMSLVTLPKLHSQYGKACETEKRYQEAAEAYERAHDMDSVVRICLEKLNSPEKAFEIVRRTASATGALMVRTVLMT
jgi:WD repeat-containing protein 19